MISVFVFPLPANWLWLPWKLLCRTVKCMHAVSSPFVGVTGNRTPGTDNPKLLFKPGTKWIWCKLVFMMI